MAHRPTEVSTISGNTIKLFVDGDIHQRAVTPSETGTPRSDYSSAGYQSLDDAEFTKISLNGLVQKTLEDKHSDIGQQMRKFLSDGEQVPKALIYTALKQALDRADPTKPILIVDRRLSFNNFMSDKVTKSSATQTEGQSPTKKMSNGIATVHFSNDSQHHRPDLSMVESASGTEPTGCTKGCLKRALAGVKLALCPPDDPVPQAERGEDKSHFIIKYLKKMRGGQKRPPYERPLEALQSLIVSFTGMLILAVIDYFLLTNTDYTLVIGSFGATAVLVFCAIKSPLAQPRNVMGGHALAAIIGSIFQRLLGTSYPWLAAALAVSISIAIMSLTHTVHPPAGATALIAVYSDDKIHNMGFMYVLTPVMGGAAILVLVAVLMNNLFPSRRYPQYWI